MKEIISILPIIIYFFVGIISLIMACKALFAKKYLPFHEQAAGIPWNNIDDKLQYVILTILRISGLGFLVIGLLLIIIPIVNYFEQDNFIKYAVPVLSLIYCFGLYLFNYLLYKKTKAKTPWKGSLIVCILLIIGILFSYI